MNVQFTFPMTQLPLWLLIVALFVAAVIYGLRRMDRLRQERMHRFVDAGLAPRLLVGVDPRLRRPLAWLTVLGAVLLAMTMMQPRWGKAWVETQRGSRDILVVLDTSESMNAQDLLPNRMERARMKIASLMEKCPGDRFGLIAFSGNAAVQCPLTLDHSYFRSVLHAVDTNTLSEEGTDIAEALREAVSVFEEDIKKTGESNRHTRAILVLSDGEQVSGDALSVTEEVGKYAGIYVMGIGSTDGAEVVYPQWMRRYADVPDAQQPHRSMLDEKTLADLAVQGGGVYVRTTPGNDDVAHIYAELNMLYARAVSGELRFNRVNRYRWPLSLAGLCFGLEGLWLVMLPWNRRRKLAKEAVQ